MDHVKCNRWFIAFIAFFQVDVSDPSTYFYGDEEDYLILNFGQVDTDNAKLILRDDMKCLYPPDCCIDVQILNNSQWQTISTLAPRAYWATEAVNLTPYIIQGEDMTIRFYWTMPHRLDYVGLDTTPQENVEIHKAVLVSACHSVRGDVRSLLTFEDDIYAELVPIQSISLGFMVANKNSQCIRDFIFFTEGHSNTA